MAEPKERVLTLETMETVGARIAKLRERRGWTHAELAEKSGLSRSYITLLEGGRYRNPGGPRIRAIATALGVSADYLLTGADQPIDADLPADIRHGLAALAPDEWPTMSELLAQRGRLPDTPEGKAAWHDVLRVALLALKGRIQELSERDQ